MKVILLKDVSGVGRAHQTIDSNDGYALNYLIPKKIAVLATPSAVKQAQLRFTQGVERKELDEKLLEQNIRTLAEARIVLRAKVNEKNHLYDAIHAADITKAVDEQVRIKLLEEVLKIDKPIKEIGTFTIPILVGKFFGSFPITVEPE